MAESDLLRHLARQTARRGELIDFPTLRAGAAAAAQRLETLTSRGDVPVVSLDVMDEETLAAAGRLVWQSRGPGLFSASSSGLQYALAAHWREQGWLPAQPSLPRAQPVPLIAVVSGSCSPATAAQIEWARANGFGVHRLEVARLVHSASPSSSSSSSQPSSPSHAPEAEAEIERAVTAAAAFAAQGLSPLVHTASGPDDPAVTGFAAMAAAAGVSREDAARRVGEALAEVMRRLLARVPLQRVVVAGGDSSGEVTGALGIDALTVQAGLAPGAPLCRAWSADRGRDGLELVLKGGQMGAASFFGAVLEGRGGR